MKPKLLYYRCMNFHQDNIRYMADHFDVIFLNSPDDDTPEILESIQFLAAPLGFFVGQQKIVNCINLKAIFSNTTGVPHIDITAAKKNGIEVISLKDQVEFLRSITATSEHTWWLIQSLLRPLDLARKSVLENKWDRQPFGGSAMLSRLHIGIIGLGRLGSLVGRYALAFGMKVSFYDPFVQCFDPSFVRRGSMEDIFSACDIITVHIPHNKKNDHCINNTHFLACRNKPIFVNTSRAEIVDNESLANAYVSGLISGIGIDVFENEYSDDIEERLTQSPLTRLAANGENVIITPHIGGSTKDAWFETQRFTVDKLIQSQSDLDRTKKAMQLLSNGMAWAFVPARGGSKSMPLKNLSRVGGLTLVERAISVANASDLLEKTIVSTDHEEIKKVAELMGAVVDLRPPSLCGDMVPTVSVVEEFFNRILETGSLVPEFIVLLEPTSPFVRAQDVKDCIDALNNDPTADSAQTVTAVPTNAHAWNQRYHNDGKSFFLFETHRRAFNKQLKPTLYHHGNVRAFRTLSLLKYSSIFGRISIPITIPQIYSFDADNDETVKLADQLSKILDIIDD